MDGGGNLPKWTRPKVLLVGIFIVFTLANVACSGQVAPTAPPVSPATDQAEMRALIEESVKAAVEKALVQSEGEVSGAAVAGASPSSDQTDVAELVSKSVSEAMAARPTPLTEVEVVRLIQAEIAPLRDKSVATSGPTTEVIKPTIVFSDLKWQSARIQNRIAMFIVEHGYGYPVDQISGETRVLWDNLLDGDSLVTMEIWLPNQQEAWDKAIIDGAVIPLGKSLDANWQGFVVPTYLT